MTLGGPGCRLQTCRRREAQWFDSTFWAAYAPRFFAPHQPSPGLQVQSSRFWGHGWKGKRQKFLLQVRLELTTPACLFSTVYKYRALTDCATGATCSTIPTNFALLFQPQKIKLKPKKCQLEPKMCHFTIQIAKKDSGLLISDGSDCLKESSWRVKDVSETWIEIYTCLHLES